MAQEFKNPALFASYLTGLAMEIHRVDKAALERAAVLIETEAKRVIGTYDYGWPPLAESTLARKSADTPLLETGEMRDSITHSAPDAKLARVGSNNDKAVWQELGTARGIPPRSFLGGAAQHKEREVVKMVGEEVTLFLSTGTVKNVIR